MIWCICTKAVILQSGICVGMLPQSMYYDMRCVLDEFIERERDEFLGNVLV